MGLDMYLSARRYLASYSDIEGPIRAEINEVAKAVREDFEIQEIVCEAMYWRKVNAIHKWFVDNVQGGVDDCGHYPVSIEQLQKLLDVVNRVLDDRSLATELLPTQSGFFFGNTDVNDWYFQDLEYTQKQLTKILSIDGVDWYWKFEYHSSW